MSSISSSFGATSSRISSQTRDAILASTQRSTLTALGLFKGSGSQAGDSSNAFRGFIQKATAGFLQAKAGSAIGDGTIARGFIENVSKFRDSLEISEDAKQQQAAAATEAVKVTGSQLVVGERRTDDGDLALSTIARELVRSGGRVRKEVGAGDAVFNFESGSLRGVMKKDELGVTAEVQVGADTIRFRMEGTVVREFGVSDERVYDTAEYRQVRGLLQGNLAQVQQEIAAESSGSQTSVVGGSSSQPSSTQTASASPSAPEVEEEPSEGDGRSAANDLGDVREVPTGTTPQAPAPAAPAAPAAPTAPTAPAAPAAVTAPTSVVTTTNANAQSIDLLKRVEQAAKDSGGEFTRVSEGVYDLNVDGNRVRFVAGNDRLDATVRMAGSSSDVKVRIRSSDGNLSFSSGSSTQQAAARTFLQDKLSVPNGGTTSTSSTPTITAGTAGFKSTLEARVTAAGANVTDNSGSKLEFEMGSDKYKLSLSGSRVTGEFKADGSGQQVNFTLDGTTLRFTSGSGFDQLRVASDLVSTFKVKVTSVSSNSLLGSLFSILG
jgi:hypothetical protein